MTTKEQFERGAGDWEKLIDFMEKNDFTCLDFLSCICSNLLHESEKDFKTELMLQGVIFKIEIKKDVNL